VQLKALAVQLAPPRMVEGCQPLGSYFFANHRRRQIPLAHFAPHRGSLLLQSVMPGRYSLMLFIVGSLEIPRFGRGSPRLANIYGSRVPVQVHEL